MENEGRTQTSRRPKTEYTWQINQLYNEWGISYGVNNGTVYGLGTPVGEAEAHSEPRVLSSSDRSLLVDTSGDVGGSIRFREECRGPVVTARGRRFLPGDLPSRPNLLRVCVGRFGNGFVVQERDGPVESKRTDRLSLSCPSFQDIGRESARDLS